MEFYVSFFIHVKLYRTLRPWRLQVCGCSLVHVPYSIFHVHHPLPIRFIQQDLCCISKPTMKHRQKLDSESDLPWVSYEYWACTFLDSLAKYMCPPTHVQCEDVVWISSSIRVFVVFILGYSTNHSPIKYECPMKRNNLTTSASQFIYNIAYLGQLH